MITVITATYNAESTLPALIESLRAQTDRDFEWIVADGRSTDRTMDILSGARGLVSRTSSQADFGVYDALNRALSLSSRPFYLVVGADDRLDPHAIESFRSTVERGEADVISASVRIGGVVIEPRKTVSWQSGPPLVAAHSVGTLIRRALHDELGPYSPRFPIAADTYFLLRAWSAGKRFQYLPQVVGEFSTGGLSGRDLLGALSESYRANFEVRGGLGLQTLGFAMRVIRHRARIRASREAR